jgi:pimeloyl-ACP methyl ester carboxylesterase
VASGGVAAVHAWEEGGAGPAVLCMHETGATGEVWRALADALRGSGRTIAFDRPGWGRSPAPETYVRTTVGEQASAAAAVLAERATRPVVLCGAGLGAVAALELALRRPELVAGSVLVEPPLLAFVPEATEALATAADLVREAVADGGRDEALARYHAGELGILSAGAERLPDAARANGPDAAQSLFAELAAVPGWELPLAELSLAPRPSVVVVGADTDGLVRRAAEGLTAATAHAELRDVGPGLPHHDQAANMAALVVEVAEAA